MCSITCKSRRCKIDARKLWYRYSSSTERGDSDFRLWTNGSEFEQFVALVVFEKEE